MFTTDLTGKYALIAGSTQGIGLATAQALADLGATCILMARNETALHAVLPSLSTNQQQQHRIVVADFQFPEQVQTAVVTALQQSPIHILVNNSGGPAAGPIVDATTDAFIATFQQHLIANHILTTAVLESMKAAHYGRIINIISTSVKVPLKGLGVSNTIRGAVASWAKTMSIEVAPFGITVNNVLPGATATGRLQAIIANKSNKLQTSKEEVSEEMLAEIPAKRFGTPEEIANVVAFLASPAASYVNGTSIPVDGGRTGAI
ncbi:MAG: SDR family oxidoreductase [Chitinophagia bacterium]|jgi:3-oxoacyl-[acyl-carrier protein] reductase|nr:SDR family oxidoreductase [Chitinophagia bacterium]